MFRSTASSPKLFFSNIWYQLVPEVKKILYVQNENAQNLYTGCPRKKLYTYATLNFRALLSMFANFRNIWKASFNSYLKLHQPCESVKKWPRYDQYSKITGFSFWTQIGYRRTHFNMCSEIQWSVLKQYSPSLKTQCTCFKS